MAGYLPNLIVIGAMKAATTSLHYYLGLHPQIFMSREKELNFFVEHGNWSRGVAWYKRQFPVNAPIRGESTPVYSFYPFFDGVPQKMHSVVSDAKLIYVLRDPIERILSNYVHHLADGSETRSIENALTDFNNNPYVFRSRYYLQLKRYLQYYPLSRILIITRESLQSRRRQTLSEVFRFLGVKEDFYDPRHAVVMHHTIFKRVRTETGKRIMDTQGVKALRRLPFFLRKTVEKIVYFPFSKRVKKPFLSNDLRQKLGAFLKDDTDGLRALTGRNFSDWSV